MGVPAMRQRYAPGDVLGSKYKLVRCAGTGAMGEVWVAQNMTLDQHVALKLFNADGKATTRSLQEARAAARLNHPGIVRTFDLGQMPDGAPYIVMELLEGQNLAAHIRRGKKSPVEAARIMLPIVSALAAAHEAGVVHRDIKPANLILAKGDGGRLRPVVVDFGLAKRDTDAKITVEGTLLGSPHYMSPEQVQAQPANEHSDIWSLCVVLYELVAGHCPFQESSEYRLLRAIVEGEPAALPKAIDPTFCTIVTRGLAKQPQARWPSMRALGVALARWLFERGVADDVTATTLRSTWLERVALPPSELPPAPDRDQGIDRTHDDHRENELSWNVPQPVNAGLPSGLAATTPPHGARRQELLRPSQAPTRDAVSAAMMQDLAALEVHVRQAPQIFEVQSVKPPVIATDDLSEESDPDLDPSLGVAPPFPHASSAVVAGHPQAAVSPPLPPPLRPAPTYGPSASLDSIERRAAETVIIPGQSRGILIPLAAAVLLAIIGIALAYSALHQRARASERTAAPPSASLAAGGTIRESPPVTATVAPSYPAVTPSTPTSTTPTLTATSPPIPLATSTTAEPVARAAATSTTPSVTPTTAEGSPRATAATSSTNSVRRPVKHTKGGDEDLGF